MCIDTSYGLLAIRSAERSPVNSVARLKGDYSPLDFWIMKGDHATMRPSPRSLFGLITLTTLFLTICSLGCSRQSEGVTSPNAFPEEPLNVIAVDRSGSTQHMRASQVSAFRAAFARAAKWGETVTVYTIDRKTSCIMAPTTLRRGQMPLPSVLKELETPSGDRSTRTRPALFWEQMVKDFAKGPTPRTIRILYLTDGGNDWLAEEVRVAKAVNQLADNSGIRIALLGINKDLYQPISDTFKVFGEERLVISVGGDRESMIQGVAAWREKGEQ